MYSIIGGDGREYGPVSLEDLRRWLLEGRANGQTRTRRNGTGDWQSLRSLPELAGLITPPPVLKPQPPSGNDSVNKIIPYRNVPALAGYYCAVFALIPFLGILLGLIAFVLGFVGLRQARQNPAAGGRVHAWAGILLGGLCGFGYSALLMWLLVVASRH